MILNKNLPLEYGPSDITVGFELVVPISKPSPGHLDYARGYITRYIMVKNSDKSGYEISASSVSNVNESIYTVYDLIWRISGKENFTKVGNIIEDYGVRNQNLQQIEKIKINNRVSLTPFLKNPLEFWRGY